MGLFLVVVGFARAVSFDGCVDRSQPGQVNALHCDALRLNLLFSEGTVPPGADAATLLASNRAANAEVMGTVASTSFPIDVGGRPVDAWVLTPKPERKYMFPGLTAGWEDAPGHVRVATCMWHDRKSPVGTICGEMVAELLAHGFPTLAPRAPSTIVVAGRSLVVPAECTATTEGAKTKIACDGARGASVETRPATDRTAAKTLSAFDAGMRAMGQGDAIAVFPCRVVGVDGECHTAPIGAAGTEILEGAAAVDGQTVSVTCVSTRSPITPDQCPVVVSWGPAATP